MVSKSGCVGWMKKRTNLEKTLLSLSSLLLLTLLLMILFGIAYHGKKTDAPSEDDGSCWSNECIETAGDILSSMDFGTDSCSDFYGFACGKYGREPEQSISASRRSIHSVYFALKNLMESRENLNINGLDDLRNFYSSCVTFGSYRQKAGATGEILIRLMNEMGVGMWPIIDPLYDTTSFSLERTLASLILLDVPVAFQMDVVPDENIPGAHLVKIYPGGPRQGGRNSSEIRSDVRLRSGVLMSILLLGAPSYNADTDVSDILSVDSSFATIDQNYTNCDVTQLPPQQSLSELRRLMPEVKWPIILSEIHNATGLVRPFGVELHCKDKIRDYVTHLKDLTDRSQMNYLGWRLFSRFVEYVIPTSFKIRPVEDEEIMVPRWRVCLELMEKFSSPLLAEALTRKIISKEVKSEVQKISQSILSTTKQLVSRTRWLTEQEKSRIREKVARIKILYPFQSRNNNTEVSVHIPQVRVSNFTDAMIHLQRRWVIQNFQKLGLEERRSEDSDIGIPLTSRSSSSSPRGLSVPVYVDTMRSPFFRLQGSEWMNYGGFGVFLAREISKILMSLNVGASSHESSAELWNLWMGHGNSSTCLLRTLTARLGIREADLTVEQRQNVTKRIFLDRSAAEIAYQSVSSASTSSKTKSLPGLQDLSKEKMFFLSHAQTLCAVVSSPNSSLNIPFKERFNAAISSFKIFHEIFSCASPSPECQIWA